MPERTVDSESWEQHQPQVESSHSFYAKWLLGSSLKWP